MLLRSGSGSRVSADPANSWLMQHCQKKETGHRIVLSALLLAGIVPAWPVPFSKGIPRFFHLQNYTLYSPCIFFSCRIRTGEDRPAAPCYLKEKLIFWVWV